VFLNQDAKKQNAAQRNTSLRGIYIMERFGHAAGY